MLYRIIKFLIWLYSITKGYKTIFASIVAIIYGWQTNNPSIILTGLVGLGIRDAIRQQNNATAQKTLILISQLLDSLNKPQN